MDEQGRYRRISDHGFERGVRANILGSNELEIKITNQWVNRLVGDQSLDPEMQVLSSGVPRFGAPRAVLLQTGDEDLWSDPKGEFLAAVDAGRVYELLGAEGLAADRWPGELVPGTISYYMHDGGHVTVPSDWDIFISFLQERL